MSDEERDFPVDKVRVVGSSFGGFLHYNPYAELPPQVWYKVGLDIAPIDLGEAAYAPEHFGTVVDTTMSLGGIRISQRHWAEIDGEYGPVEDVGDSSIYVSNTHVPIDIESVVFRWLAGARFRIELQLLIAFEWAGAGYRDARLNLATEAAFDGLGFNVPQWTDPNVTFPKEWRIPSDFNDRTVSKMVSRFVDTDGYRLERSNDSFHFTPVDSDSPGAMGRYLT